MVEVYRNHALAPQFIPEEYLPPGENQYYLRNLQASGEEIPWRGLTKAEITALETGGNSAEDWSTVLVCDPFLPEFIRRSSFSGLVRIGRLDGAVLEFHDLRVRSGIDNCRIIDCDIGNDAALQNLSYCAHYRIGDACILRDIDELHVTNHAKFGNGILKEGEPESDRVWLDLMNEAGNRAVLPFDGMRTADAYLWGKYRDDGELMQRLKAITQASNDPRRGYYGSIGKGSVIKSSRIIKDVAVGEACYIKGANKLKNLTVNSSAEEPSQIGEGVELVNGIIGYGSRVFYGCKAVRFMMGNNTSLKYGARLIHSFLGDNSTISCCEVLNNLIFPAHEQHHNNSFLIASVVMGQSNMAAGATVGSNHNSRANDNELVAGRGFWPGLCTSLKHPSRFAAYTLIAKGDYPAELNQPLPFSLLNNNESRGELEIIPAFWWNYNMYALIRNAKKYAARDRRIRPSQQVEFDFLAPDTAAEIWKALSLLDEWDPSGEAGELEAPRGLVERTSRRVRILKADKARIAYREMLSYYIASTLLPALEEKGAGLVGALAASEATEPRKWINLGGQLVPEEQVDRLRAEIRTGDLNDWEAIHRRYDEWHEEYGHEKVRDAFDYFRLLEGGTPDTAAWRRLFAEAERIQALIVERVRESRNKDLQDPFKALSFRSDSERTAVQGTIDENEFVRSNRAESDTLIDRFRSAATLI